jgi:hypothetical protein
MTHEMLTILTIMRPTAVDGKWQKRDPPATPAGRPEPGKSAIYAVNLPERTCILRLSA